MGSEERGGNRLRRVEAGLAWILSIAGGLLLLASGVGVKAAQQSTGSSTPQQPAQQTDPTLSHRPPPKVQSSVVPEGKIQLDVMVSDGAGKPALGLEPWDFKILDNNQPRKVLSFHAYDGATVMPDPPVEVLLVIDTVNLPFPQVAATRQQIEQFLQQNGGHLKQPVRLLLLSDAGMRVQPRSSVDGNALVSVVREIKGSVKVINSAMGGEGLLERFQLCARQMASIAENEARTPGRKLLVWVGPGWPILNRPALGSYSEKDQQRFFDSAVELSNRLREARIVVNSVAPATDDTAFVNLYQAYLKPVKSPQDASSGSLALKVLATHTGGMVLGPDNDLVGQINRCVDEADAFYRVSFDPPAAGHPWEYHDLKVVVDKPGLTARTNTGYYNEPPGN